MYYLTKNLLTGPSQYDEKLYSKFNIKKRNAWFETMVLNNNPSGLEVELEYRHTAKIYKTNVPGITLVEEYYPNGTEKLYINHYGEKTSIIKKLPKEMEDIVKECRFRGEYIFNYFVKNNKTYELTSDFNYLVEIKKVNKELNIDLYYVGYLFK